MNAPTLFDQEPTQGRTRASDPVPSVTAAKRSSVPQQRATIAGLFDAGLEYVTADVLYELHPESARGTWSTRLGGLVADGVLVKRAELVPGPSQMVTAYELNGVAGRAWVADLLRRAS